MKNQEIALRDSQKEAIKFVANKQFSFIFGGTSFGKTLTIIYYLKFRLDKSVVILVHNKTMIKQWKSELKKHIPEHKNIKVAAFTIPIADVREYWDKKNYETMVDGVLVTKTKRYKCYDRTPINYADIVIIDEVHKLKGRGERYKYVAEVGFKQLIGLTGTPIENDEDWLTYFKLARTHINTLTKFRQYFEAKGYNAMTRQKYDKFIVENYKVKTPNFVTTSINKEKLKEAISEFSITFETHEIVEEVQKIEEKIFNIVTIMNMNLMRTLLFRTNHINYKNWHKKRQIIHNYSKRFKLQEIIKRQHESIVVVTNYIVEKEYLLKKFKNSTEDYDVWFNSKTPMILVAGAKNTIFTGSDGMQKITNKIIFWSPVTSTTELRQICGRINRFGMIEQPELTIFYIHHEMQIWKNTFEKLINLEHKS